MLNEFSKCKNCSFINPPYKSNCEQCKYHLRDRVVNIDLWNTIKLLIENPSEAFKQIIFSEHKNFISFLIFFISIKNLILARFLSVPALGLEGVRTDIFLSIFFAIVVTLITLTLLSYIQSAVYKRSNSLLRYKDLIALNSFSSIPLILGLFLIFPVELIVLGLNIFSNNPFPFQIKPMITYILIGFEVLTLIWSFFLFVKSIIILNLKISYIFILAILGFLLWMTAIYILSIFAFSF